MASITMKLSERLWRLFDWRRPRPVSSEEHAASSGTLPLTPARGSRETTTSRLEQGYEQIVEVMDAVKTHTRDQAERSERLLEAVSDLPEAVVHLQQVSETQRKMAALMQKQIASAAEERTVMNAALERLAIAYESERESLRVIADSLMDRKKSDGVLADRLGTLGSTLGRLDETSQASTLMLRTLAERTKRSDTQVRDLYDKGRRQTMVLAGVSLAVALVAVIVAGVAVIAAGASWGSAYGADPAPTIVVPIEPTTQSLVPLPAPPAVTAKAALPAIADVPPTVEAGAPAPAIEAPQAATSSPPAATQPAVESLPSETPVIEATTPVQEIVDEAAALIEPATDDLETKPETAIVSPADPGVVTGD
ncbi:MAG: hypothetical protein RIG82_12450 [Phycisphaeraceae bacterium]